MSIVEVKVPELSESVSEASLIEWKKKVGEPVKADEILIEIETDKIVFWKFRRRQTECWQALSSLMVRQSSATN